MKTNNAPIETLELPDGSTADLPTADVGDTVTYTLTYDIGESHVNNAVITDVVPEGLEYIDGSASSNEEFTFDGYNTATRTLTWTAEHVTEDGFVTYQALVQEGAAELGQLRNTATIDSDETEPDSDESDVYVPGTVGGETDVPSAPPTDVLEPTEMSQPGSSLPLILAILGVILLTVGLITPVPATTRRRNRR